jgi:hypothetical protein
MAFLDTFLSSLSHHSCSASRALQLTQATFAVETNLPALFDELEFRLAPFVPIVSSSNPRDGLLTVMVLDNLHVPDLSDAERVVVQSHPSVERYNRTARQLRDESGVFTINERSGSCTFAQPDTRRIWMVGKDAGALTKDARRLIRDLHLEATKRAGYATLHAGAVALRDQTVLFLGPSGSGKSSFLFDALRIPGVDYISNDRVFCRVIDQQVQMLGAPEHILVRIGSLGRVEKLRSRLPERFSSYSAGQLWNVPDSEKISIQYRELAELFGSRIASHGIATRIALPRFQHGKETSRWEKVTPRGVLAELRGSYDEAIEHRMPPWHGFWDLDFPRVAANQARIEEFIAAHLPATALYRDNDSFEITKRFMLQA